ncbi:MAG: HlyD family efflux transporter periplasmic adaptor subunit [Cocleimonas sp.]
MKILLPILILVSAFFLAKYLIATGPEVKKKPFVERLPVVEVIPLKPQDYSVNLKASGIVRAGTQTNLVSEVSGRIIKISDVFNEGSYFNKNQTLLTIDASDYKNALAITASDIAGSKALLDQLKVEESSTKRSYTLAKNNLGLGKVEVSRKSNLWKKKLIARSVLDAEKQKLIQLQQRVEDSLGKLNAFTSRKLAIESKISATRARQNQENLNISRTMIKTPYSGRVLQKNVDIGQFVTKGTGLGIVYATDYVYVDLPLSLNQYELLGIPETFQNKSTSTKNLPKVTFNSTNSRLQSSWQGQIVRTSAALDSESRQIKVIARINNPFVAKAGVSAPVRIGQYLDANIKGKTFRNVYVLPAGAVRQNKEIMLLKNGKVHIVPVDVLVNTSKQTIIKPKENIEGESLITTSLNQATQDMKVITLEQQQEKLKKMENKKEKAEKIEKISFKTNAILTVVS